MAQPFDLTVSQAAAQIRAGELVPVELMESLLARIQTLDPRLKAWQAVDFDAAMAAAQRSQDELSKSGPVGPIHGVPVGFKDIFYTEGMRTEAGTKFWEGFVPEYDATSVAKLKAAGGLVLGKTVTTQFADGDPARSLNPWNSAHTPGGSSTGSAVAVAARMAPAALGSQTVGSVLRPAAYNGIVGLKPTYGRISKYGVVDYANFCDHVGVLARSVEDTALLLSIMAGPDEKDITSSQEPVADYMAGLAEGGAPPHIGVLRGYFTDHSGDETRQNLDWVIGRLAEAGATVEEIDTGVDFEEMFVAHNTMVPAEAAAFHESMFRDHSEDYGPKITAIIEKGVGISGMEYARASQVRAKALAQIGGAMERVGVLLSPTAVTPAPKDLTNTGDLRFQSPWTFLGLPSISLPSGLAKDGLPFGIQFAAGAFQEARLLSTAAWCERVLDVRLAPPITMG